MKRGVFLLLAVVWLIPVASAQTPAPPANGAALYEQRCASCHGLAGRAEGEYVGLLNPRPRDFTSGRYKFRSTETGALPTDDDLAHSITEGLRGTSMPAWRGLLAPDQVQVLVG